MGTSTSSTVVGNNKSMSNKLHQIFNSCTVTYFILTAVQNYL